MKLEGIRVLDLSLFLPGPYATQLMADNGAEVIKIEPPTGEPTREIGWRRKGRSVFFNNTQRGKKSVVIDLKSAEGKAAFLALARTADVLIEAFRPGVVTRLGIGYEALAALNPRLVYCSISAFGQTGPERDRPAHDMAVEALAGALSVNLGRDGLPTHPNIPIADATASLLALSGILMALLRRQKTGRGDYVDLSMFDAVISWLPNATGRFFAEGKPPTPRHERQWGGGSFYEIYATKDGKHVVLGGAEHKFVANLLTKIGRPDLIAAGSGPPGPAHDPVKAVLCAFFKTMTRDECEAYFAGLDVAFAPVLDMVEAFARPHVQAREMLMEDAQGHLHLGTPIKFRDEPARIDMRLPELGEHNADILGRRFGRKD